MRRLSLFFRGGRTASQGGPERSYGIRQENMHEDERKSSQLGRQALGLDTVLQYIDVLLAQRLTTEKCRQSEIDRVGKKLDAVVVAREPSRSEDGAKDVLEVATKLGDVVGVLLSSAHWSRKGRYQPRLSRGNHDSVGHLPISGCPAQGK